MLSERTFIKKHIKQGFSVPSSSNVKNAISAAPASCCFAYLKVCLIMLQDAAEWHACTVNAYRQYIYIYIYYFIYIFLRYVHILINILVRAARRQQQQHQQFATNFICAKVVNKRKTSDNILKYITCRQAEREKRGKREGEESERETDTVHGRYV